MALLSIFLHLSSSRSVKTLVFLCCSTAPSFSFNHSITMHFLLISFLLPFLSFTLADINGPTYPNATVTTTTNTIVTATTNATVSVTTSATVSITTSATGYSTSTTLLPTSFPTLTPVGFEYYLRSQLARTGGPARFANLYVQAYHTGAGLNDVVLLERDEYSAKGTSFSYPIHASYNIPKANTTLLFLVPCSSFNI